MCLYLRLLKTVLQLQLKQFSPDGMAIKEIYFTILPIFIYLCSFRNVTVKATLKSKKKTNYNNRQHVTFITCEMCYTLRYYTFIIFLLYLKEKTFCIFYKGTEKNYLVSFT